MKIGVQTYSLLGFSQREGLNRTFRIIADAGFDSIEPVYFDYGMSLKEIGGLMRSYGLTAPSAHVPCNVLSDRDELGKMLDAYEFKHAVIPHVAYEVFADETKFSETVHEAIENAKYYSLTLSYHNHDFEFADGDKLSPLPLKYPPLMLQPDVFWLKSSGIDPIGFLEKNAEFVSLVHLKEFGENAADFNPIVGSGNVGAKEIIKFAARRSHDAIILEYERINVGEEEYLKKSRKFIAETANA